MSIDIKDVLTLNDGNKYIVVSKTNYNDKTYYLIIDINNNTNIKFCYLDNDELVESEDKIINTKLLPLLYSNVPNQLSSILNKENNDI